jgi:hypothetical protein
MTQLDDGRQMREAMPYEISYLQVCISFAVQGMRSWGCPNLDCALAGARKLPRRA